MKQSILFDLVQNELKTMETELACTIQSQADLVTDVSDHLFFAGGKFLRSGLYFLCARNSQRILSDKMPVAVAIELTYLATLVHDHVLDKAVIRREMSTESARCCGNHATVLVGDFLFAKAFSLIVETSNIEALNIFFDVICTICEGQVSRVRDKFNLGQTEEDYLNRIAKTTADFMGASCKLGAIAAELDTATVEALHQYGYAIGMAFQITNDIRDIIPSQEQMGKSVSNDLRQGVLNLPVIYALQTSPRQDELKELILAQDMSDAKLRQCVDIIRGTSAVDYAQQRVDQYLDRARRSIPGSLSDDVQKALFKFVDFVSCRKC